MTTSSTPTNPVTLTDSWENRINAAATFLGVPTKEVLQALKELGVEEEPAGMEMLSDESITPFGDLMKVFGDARNVPIAKVRLAAKYLRGPKDSPKTESLDPELVELKKKYGLKLRMQDADPADLLQYYHPDKPSHPVTRALKKRFGTQAIIAFKPDSKVVDVEATADYIEDIEQGYPEQDTVESGGVLVRLYAVGQVPNQMVDEDPLFPGQPLKRERSVVNRVNWNGINEETRKFCRIIVDNDEIDVNNKIEVRQFMKLVAKGIQEMAKIYEEAYLEYRELKQKDELPKLHLSLEEVNGNGNNNPFGIKNRQY
jgi:hypothetical protein